MEDRRFYLFIAETFVFVAVGIATGIYVFDSIWAASLLGMFAVLVEHIFFYIVLIEKALYLLLTQMDCLIGVKRNEK